MPERAPLFWLPGTPFRPGARDPMPWRDAGLHPIPVLPPDAAPRADAKRSVLKGWPKAAGKAPGICHLDGTWSPLNDWRKRRFSRMEMLGWRHWQPRPNLGLALGGFGFLDCDVLHPALTRVSPMVHELALMVLGPAPLRVGLPPKFGMLYRLAEPFRRQAVKFRHPDDAAATGLVEFLALGQQVVTAGVHPGTREPYGWDEDPTRIRATGLTEVTHDGVAVFAACLKAMLETEGFVVDVGGSRGAGPPPDQSSLKAPDGPVLLEIAEHVPNIVDSHPSRHDAITMGYRFKAAAQDFDDQGFWAWWHWLSKYDGPITDAAADFNNDLDVARDEWRRMAPPYRTGGYPTLRNMAMACGWHGGVPHAGPVGEPPEHDVAQARDRNRRLTAEAFACVDAWRARARGKPAPEADAADARRDAAAGA